MSAAPAVIAAQRRPERQPRLHPVGDRRRVVACPRSTKAGASTPATRSYRWTQTSRLPTLNEGRSVNPGYTGDPKDDRARVSLRSTKAGASTPATQRVGVVLGRVPRRSTKAGASTPATRENRSAATRWAYALNEGRSVNPGYTRILSLTSPTSVSAQRRPERQPRLHVTERLRLWAGDCAQRRPERQPRLHTKAHHGDFRHRARSTKAGASTPATQVGGGTDTSYGSTAQRRPERQPRLHVELAAVGRQREKRSTKAGASTPATPHRGHPEHHRGRPLNEGRSVNPGYTRTNIHTLPFAPDRSTKAGASTPATLAPIYIPSRSLQTAQRRPERQPRLHSGPPRYSHS